MPKNLTIQGAREEELIEAKCILDSFAQEDAANIIDSLNGSEDLDHKNDRIRGEVMGFLLKSMESYSAKDYEGMQRNLHAAMQKLNAQGILDEKDDIPRTEAKIQILQLQMKMVHASHRIVKLIERCGKNRKANYVNTSC